MQLRANRGINQNKNKTKKNIKIFTNGVLANPSKRKYLSSKSDIYYVDEIWSLDL